MESFMDVVLENRKHWYDCQTKPETVPEWPGLMRCMLLGLSFRCSISRLNSGIFGIFKLSACNLNLNSSDCGASKIIYNDTKLEPIPWEQTRENSLLNFCVGILWKEKNAYAKKLFRFLIPEFSLSIRDASKSALLTVNDAVWYDPYHPSRENHIY